MRKRILAILMSIVMLVGLMPVTVMAAETTPITISVSNQDELEAALTGESTNVIISVTQNIELSKGFYVSGSRTIKLVGATDGIIIKFADDASLTDASAYSMFYFAENADVSMTVEKITLDGNQKGRLFLLDTTGSGNRNSLTLNEKAVLQNGKVNESDTYKHGGAVALRGCCDFTMNADAIIQNNSATKYGGGIFGWNDDINVTINGGTIKNNSGEYAGGIALLGTYNLYLDNVTIENNTGTTAGHGGVYF